jgi:hypothetical protein
VAAQKEEVGGRPFRFLPALERVNFAFYCFVRMLFFFPFFCCSVDR